MFNVASRKRHPQWGTAGAEIQASSVEKPELPNVLPVNP